MSRFLLKVDKLFLFCIAASALWISPRNQHKIANLILKTVDFHRILSPWNTYISTVILPVQVVREIRFFSFFSGKLEPWKSMKGVVWMPVEIAVESLTATVAELNQTIMELREQLNKNSNNSSNQELCGNRSQARDQCIQRHSRSTGWEYRHHICLRGFWTVTIFQKMVNRRNAKM